MWCKETLLRLLTGVLAPSNLSGTISAGGVRVPRRRRHRSAVADCLT